MECIHPSFIDNECTSCNQYITNCGNPATVRCAYIHPMVAFTTPGINQVRELNLQSLLSRKKLHLILDLDHTLVHARRISKLRPEDKETIECMEDVYKFSLPDGEHAVKLRPGVRDFLKEVSSMYDLSVYTMGIREYAHKVVEFLGGRSKFLWVITREDCVRVNQKGFESVLSHKHVSLIVDDTKDVWEESCKGNLVQISRYNFFPIMFSETKDMDDELARVLNIVREVHSTFYDGNYEYGKKDVKEILPRSLDLYRPKRLRIRFNGVWLHEDSFATAKRCKTQEAINTPCLV